MPPDPNSADFLPADVRQKLSQGDKIGAIKLLREATGLGLAEAKAAVEAGHLRQGATARRAPAAVPSATLEGVADALRRGNKIEAIRLFREIQGVGLKEAKDAVDAMERAARSPSATPELSGLAPGEVPRSGGWLGWAVVAAVLGLLGYWLWGPAG